ncbi:MAG: DNA mismatch repair endonuclease MutL [Candidatus Helarchaeota archaeon]|nr:DNA mismatch repair endonuclease MutL [Candidatus Helarchaeota archaeon]
MGKKIHILDENLRNKIAAGEVIERPASVVKELIENSIDAGATSIVVKITEGGKKLIEIVDDGEGMTKDDAVLSFERYATSKIEDISDLKSLTTFGFRGEALSSIAAVSLLEIITKTEDQDVGIKIGIKAGNIEEINEIGCNTGTTIFVKNLFFNLPARRKYLKSTETELNHIIDVISKYALIFPSISFNLFHNNKNILFSPKSSEKITNLSYLENIAYIYGKEIAKEMIPIKFENEFQIYGFISKPTISKINRDYQAIYVNNRTIRSNLVSRAVEDAYGNLIPKKRHPIVILSILINPEQIDVNIHPTKKEIRFLNEDLIYQSVYDVISQKLQKSKIIPVEKTPKPKKRKLAESKSYFSKAKTLDSLIQSDQVLEKTKARTIITSKKTDFPSMYLIGQFHNTYIATQDDENLYLIDQHAAAERVQYEKIVKNFGKFTKSQILLKPITFDVPQKEAIFLQNSKNLETLTSFGFDIKHFGGNTFIIRSVPVVFGKILNQKVITEFLDDLNIGKDEFHSQIQDLIFKSMACHSSIRAGQALSQKRIEQLINNLKNCDDPFSCPHGRPTIISFNKPFLEKKFKRRN